MEQADVVKWIETHQADITKITAAFVKEFECAGMELDDLVQEANITLFRRLHKYDSSGGDRISTYVFRLIRSGMHEVRSRNGMINRQTKKPPKRIPARSIYYTDSIYKDEEGNEIGNEIFIDHRQDIPAVIEWEDALVRSISQLSDDTDFIIMSKLLESGNMSGAATAAGVTSKTASLRARRIMDKIKEKL